MRPREKPRDALRIACLPLDCPTEDITNLVATIPGRICANTEAFDEYCDKGRWHLGYEPAEPAGVSDIHDWVSFAVGYALGLHYSNPLKDTRYEHREITGSAEHRMLHHPLQKHPGLSYRGRIARQFYVATVTGLFEERNPKWQAELLGVMLTAQQAELAEDTTLRAYDCATTDADTVGATYARHVDVADDGTVTIPAKYASQACQLLPEQHSPISDCLGSSDLRYLTYTGEKLTMPPEHVRLKLAEYLWHGWGRLVNIAYNTLPRTSIDRLLTATTSIEKQLFDRFHGNNKIFDTPYRTETQNPLHKAQSSQQNPAIINTRISEDKRLITIVDCIRAFSDLQFDAPLSVDKLFNYCRFYFPAPCRPGNDIMTRETICDTIRDATHSDVTLTTDSATGTQTCSIPAPADDPYFPLVAKPPWDVYRQLLNRQQTDAIPTETYREGRSHHKRSHPLLAGDCLQQYAQIHHSSVDTAQQAAVREPRLTTLAAVQPRVDPQTIPQLTEDELVFLTRVALAMERQLSDVTLTQSMRPLRDNGDGVPLEIDEAKLIEQEWLERHDESRGVLYSVPHSKRTKLGVPNVSHDGYGEQTPTEKSVHRKGVDKVAVAFAAKSEIDTVVRYCDLWRLQNTACEQALKTHDLLSSRIDVVGFNGTSPMCAAGIETQSHNPTKPQKTVQKLTALTDTLDTWLVAPNSDHLWKIMRQLNDPAGLAFKSFPDSSADVYNPANWRELLQNQGILGTDFTHVHTYHTIDNHTHDSENTQQRDTVVGNI